MSIIIVTIHTLTKKGKSIRRSSPLDFQRSLLASVGRKTTLFSYIVLIFTSKNPLVVIMVKRIKKRPSKSMVSAKD